MPTTKIWIMAWVTLWEEEIADPEVPQAVVEVQDMIFMPIVCICFCRLIKI